MADQLGSYNVSSTRTAVRFAFTTHAASGAAVAPSSAFENADLKIYKDGSATERSSASGITMTSPFDSVTGLHHVSIDLTDNTDAGFWAAGSFYMIVLSPDETVDSLAVVKVLAYFEIGPPPANVTQLLGTAWLAPAVAGTPDVNVKQLSGDSTAADNAEAFFDGTGYAGTNNVIPTVTLVNTLTTYSGNTPQTGDSFARIGATGSGLSTLATQASANTIAGYLDTEIAAIKTKTDFLPSATAGAAGGLMIAGSNAATTFATLTVSGATTLTGNVALAAGLVITQSTADTPAVSITGNASGPGMLIAGGATGEGVAITSSVTGLSIANTVNFSQVNFASASGPGVEIYGGTGSSGVYVNGLNAGVEIVGAVSGINIFGAAGEGVLIWGTTDGVSVVSTDGHGIVIAPAGTDKHGILVTGGTGGVSDGIKAVAGTGGVPFRGDITGNITGNLSGTVGSVVGAVGSVATGGITAASFAAGAIDAAAIATDAIGAAEISAAAVTKIQAGLSTYAGGDTAGTTTLLTRLSAIRAGYLDNINNATLASAAFPADPADQSLVIAATNAIVALIGAPVVSLAADIAAIEAQTDDIGAAGAGLTAVPWNVAWDAEVQSEVQDAIEVNHLDHLLAADYDPAAKPGVATALLNELIGSDAGVSQFTANSLELAPTGGSAPTVEAIRAEIDANSTQLAAIKAKTDSMVFTVAGSLDVNVQHVNDVQIVGTGTSGDEWGPI